MPGTRPLYLRIADITIAILDASSDLTIGADEATRRFQVDPAKPDSTIRCAWGDLGEEIDAGEIFAAGDLWQLASRQGAYRFRFRSPTLGRTPYKTALFDPDFCFGEISLDRRHFNPDQPVYPLEYPLDELLMLHLLAMGRGAEVHACGLVDPGGHGHLFLGNSGAGKTTLARLFERVEGMKVLSDDRIILRHLDNRLWTYGTPWHGEAAVACPDRAPLKRIYFVRHGQSNTLIPQRPAQAVSRLFACCFPLFYSAEALSYTLGFFEEVVKAVPCHELQFLPDARVVDFVLRRDER
jgi:hypothetical protein